MNQSRPSLARFLEDCGDDFLSWRDGCVVVETFYANQFSALGGDTNRMISFFTDYGNMNEASRHYLDALNKLGQLAGENWGHIP